MALKSEYIRELRLNTKEPGTNNSVTQSYVAFHSGIAEATLSRMERFSNTKPSAECLKKLADFYGVDINTLIE